jgi:hypothetical protein
MASIPTAASIAAATRKSENQRAATYRVLRDMHRGRLVLQAQHVNGRLHWRLSNGKIIAAETAELVAASFDYLYARRKNPTERRRSRNGMRMAHDSSSANR